MILAISRSIRVTVPEIGRSKTAEPAVALGLQPATRENGR